MALYAMGFLVAIISELLCNAFADPSPKTYVKEGSVDCRSTGVYFQLDMTVSELYVETHFDVTLYTANNTVVDDVDFDKITGKIYLPFSKYYFDAVTAYGPGQIPILYDIDQPFFAVPNHHVSNRNYTFGVYCVVPATWDVHVIANTTDDGHGGHGGDVINPKDHIGFRLTYAHTDVQLSGEVALGDALQFRIYLKDDTYASFMPVTCQYFNPNEKKQVMAFVLDSCPLDLGSPDQFGLMSRINGSYYDVIFRAFMFSPDPPSLLGLSCDVLLCVKQTVNMCNKGCWGSGISTTSLAVETTTTTQETSTASFEGSTASSEPTTYSTAAASSTGSTFPPWPPTTTVAASPSLITESTTSVVSTSIEPYPPSTPTPTPTTKTTMEAYSDTTKFLTTSYPWYWTTGEPTSATRPAFRASNTPAKRSKRALNDQPEPTTTTTNYDISFSVKTSPQNPTAAPVSTTCTDSSLLTALYGIIGFLCALMVLLVLALIYITITMRRRRKSAATGAFYAH